MIFPERPKNVRTRVAIIVPALNEAACLPSTLDSIRAAAELLRAREVEVETVVVDNDSDDETASVARAEGATVVREPVRNIARARNTGARHAAAEVLVFVDADVLVPPSLFDAIHAAMGDSECVGSPLHRPVPALEASLERMVLRPRAVAHHSSPDGSAR